MRWRIELLGHLRAVHEDRVITRFRTQKTAALLAYLAYHNGQHHRREVLVDLLWPESDLSAGRANLSMALSSLRHQLEPPGMAAGSVIVADRTAVALNAEAVVTDVGQFEAALRSAAETESSGDRAQLLAYAVELYQGQLLPGHYEEWIVPEQQRLAELHFQAVRQLVAHLEGRHLDRAIQYARRAVSADPLREAAHRELMRLYAAAGQPAEALRQYRELERVLGEQIGTGPHDETRALAEQLERAAARAQSPGRVEPLPSERAPAAAPDRPGSGMSRAEVPTRQSPTGIPLPDGTVTFLLAEPGSARPGAADSLPAQAREPARAMRQAVERHGGAVIRLEPASLAAAFRHASDAAAAAISVRRAARGGRVALVSAEAELRDGTYRGESPSRLAALLHAGHPGQILCSETTAALLRAGRDAGPGGSPGETVRVSFLGVFHLGAGATPGVGDAPERLYQLDDADSAGASFPPPNAAGGPRGSLPLRLTRFFGRERELEDLVRLLGPPGGRNAPGSETPACRLVTLTGPGGCGKTRLALEAARRLAEPFQQAVWFVPLADVSDPQRLAAAVRDALRLPAAAGAAPFRQVMEALTGGHPAAPALLVLDNYEQLVAGAAGAEDDSRAEPVRLVQLLLEEAPGLRCLVTSRQPLGLEGEREVRVLPLPTPNGPDAPERLARCASVQLFVDRAQAVRPDFQVTPGNAATVAELCDRLEGIPLAIELAAARAQVLTPPQMLRQLAQRFGFLVSRRRDLPARHRTLRAAVDWSYRLLTPELQRFFALLSVFRGGWTLEAAEAMAAGHSAAPGPGPDVLDLLAQLRECSLLLVEEGPGAMRFSMLESLREYAAEQLGTAEQPALAAAHARYYLSLAEQAAPALIGPEQAAWFARLDREQDNVRAALAWGERNDPGLALRLCAALGRFWEVRSRWAEGRRSVARALEAHAARSAARPVGDRASGPGPLPRIEALRWAGHLAYRQGDHAGARRLLGRSLALAREVGDRERIAALLNHLGCVAWAQDDLDTARAYHGESLSIRRALGDRWGTAQSLSSLGDVAAAEGDLAAAAACFEESLSICQAVGHQRGIAACLGQLARLARAREEFARAGELLEEALAISRAVGDRLGIGAGLHDLGRVAEGRGDTQRARACYEESLSIMREIGSLWGIAGALHDLGNLAAADGETEVARRLLAESLEIRRSLASTRGAAATLACLERVNGAATQANGRAGAPAGAGRPRGGPLRRAQRTGTTR